MATLSNSQDASSFSSIRDSISIKRDTWIGLYTPNSDYNYYWVDGSNSSYFYTQLASDYTSRCVETNTNSDNWSTRWCGSLERCLACNTPNCMLYFNIYLILSLVSCLLSCYVSSKVVCKSN